jgi:hypothetical protein
MTHWLAAFDAAFARADAAALDSLLTAAYVHTNGGTGAVLDKSRWLEYISAQYISARRVALETGRLRVTQVRVYRERRWRRAAFHDSPVSGP